MSGFKKPKAYVPGKAVVGNSMASKKAMADDMGFSSLYSSPPQPLCFTLRKKRRVTCASSPSC